MSGSPVAKPAQSAAVGFVVAVGEVEADNVHPLLQQAGKDVLTRAGGTDGRDDFCETFHGGEPGGKGRRMDEDGLKKMGRWGVVR